MKIFGLFFYNLLLVACLYAAPTVDLETVYEDSSIWPFRVSYTGSYYAEGKTPFNAKLPGVLIRVEEVDQAYHAVVDFGGGGVHSIPAEFTDLAEGAAEVREGRAKKQWPNHVMLLANKLLFQADGLLKPLRAHELAPYAGFAFVYLNGLNKDLIGNIVDQLPEDALADRLVVVIPEFGYKEGQMADTLSEEFGFTNFAIPRSFLSAAIKFSLAFDPTSQSPILLTDLEGKIVSVEIESHRP